jgi:hypothetical protein
MIYLNNKDIARLLTPKHCIQGVKLERLLSTSFHW